ncbi:hypothetical protein [Streptomyces sp. NPDC057677]|uniref:hypothetical protein n=1 Tax=unclassified Streptomyces TaxID=2593676 RepID=UPI0036A6F147
MDQGDAAVLAAAITGLVGIGGAFAAFAAGKAQARGVVEGVKLQLSGQRDHELWVDQRDAYASFLAGIDDIRTRINIVASAAVAECRDQVPPHGETYNDAVSRLDGQLTSILGVLSKLRLSIDAAEAESADQLTMQARFAKNAVVTWAARLRDQHPADVAAEQDRMVAMIGELDAGISSWTEKAREQLRKDRA